MPTSSPTQASSPPTPTDNPTVRSRTPRRRNSAEAHTGTLRPSDERVESEGGRPTTQCLQRMAPTRRHAARQTYPVPQYPVGQAWNRVPDVPIWDRQLPRAWSRGSSGNWPWRDGSDRRRTPSRRHATPVSGTENCSHRRATARFAGVGTASRSDVRSGRRLSDPAVGSTMPSPSTSGRPPRLPPINPDDNDRPDNRSHTDSAQHHPNPHSATQRNPTTTPPTETPKPPKTTTTEHHLQSLTNARTRVDTLAGSAKRNPTGVVSGVITERFGPRLEIRRVRGHTPSADLPCRHCVQTYRADVCRPFVSARSGSSSRRAPIETGAGRRREQAPRLLRRPCTMRRTRSASGIH